MNDEKFRKKQEAAKSSKSDDRKRKRSDESREGSSSKVSLDLRTNKQRMLDLQEKEENEEEPINPKLGA